MATVEEEDWADVVAHQENVVRAKMEAMRLKSGAGGGTAVSPGASPLPAATSATSTHMLSTQARHPAASAPASNVPSGDSVQEDDNAASRADASFLNKLLRSRLVDSKSDIEVLRRDPNSPLHSVKNFELLNLKKELLEGLYKIGFMAPSKIQENALPILLADPPCNMIAQAQSGTGKTAAFVLTMLSRVDTAKSWPQCLCLAPTYELALQIGDVTKRMGQCMSNVRIKFAVRGESFDRKVPLTEHIVIGTPGTAVDWSTRHRLFDLKKINVFVLDEADVMIDQQGHQDQSVRVRQNLRDDCQMLLFSATYDDDVMKFANRIIPNAEIIRLRREEESLDNIGQYYIDCKDINDKYEALTNIYGTISVGSCIIFCKTRKTASWLAERMTKEGHKVALLTGELVVEQRAAVIHRFREGKERVLISTNVTARGIDVEQVNLVVNFDLPTDMTNKVDCETYLHRIGRTGRFGQKGVAINMVDGPQAKTMLREIENHFGRKIKKLDAEDVDAIEKIGN